MNKKICNVIVKIIESVVVLGCIVCCFVEEYPTYHTAVISMESWPKFFLGGVAIMTLMGSFRYTMTADYKIKNRYNRNVLAFVASVCALALGKALIDDVGDALVMYEDFHTSSVISGWTSLFIMTIIVCLYGVWIFYKADAVSKKMHYKLHKIAVLDVLQKQING